MTKQDPRADKRAGKARPNGTDRSAAGKGAAKLAAEKVRAASGESRPAIEPAAVPPESAAVVSKKASLEKKARSPAAALEPEPQPDKRARSKKVAQPAPAAPSEAPAKPKRAARVKRPSLAPEAAPQASSAQEGDQPDPPAAPAPDATGLPPTAPEPLTRVAVAAPPPSGSETPSEEEIWSDGLVGGAPGLGSLRDAEEALSAAFAGQEDAPASRLTRSSSGDRLREAAAFGSAQSLLSTDYYFRQYGAHGMRSRAAEVDDFGFDPHVDEKVRPLLETLCKRYFRVELVGAEQIPEQGRALLVANRSGALPWDGLVLRTTLRASRPGLSPLRWLSEDSVIHYPFMGVFMNRLGAVRACPENAERLLMQERLVAVFPEGAQGSRKLFRDRYRLQRFGRGGYVRLALKLGLPILPTAIIGAEETNPVLRRSRVLGRLFGGESLPITPTFPWLGVAGLLPAPVRWRIAVGEAIDLSRYGAQAADDALLVHRLNEQIRSSLQALVDQNKVERGGALFG